MGTWKIPTWLSAWREMVGKSREKVAKTQQWSEKSLTDSRLQKPISGGYNAVMLWVRQRLHDSEKPLAGVETIVTGWRYIARIEEKVFTLVVVNQTKCQ